MEKIISILLHSEENAFKASQEINQLDKDGDIRIIELYVLNKDENGEVQIKNAKNQMLPYSATGALAGSFIGILGGPLGVFFGMTTGLLAGSIGDIFRSSRTSKFLEKASKVIPAGNTAIVAHINEYWETPLNTTLKPYDAEIKRLNINVEIEKYIAEEQRLLSEEIDDLTVKLEQATDEEKQKINSRIEQLKTKKQLFHQEMKENINEEKASASQWFEKVKVSFSNWRADIADRFDDSKEDLVDDYKELKEDYAEIASKIKTGLRRLSDTTEESFKRSVSHIKEDINELDEDILELKEEIEKLGEKDKARWQAKLDKLKLDRDELLVKAKSEFDLHKEKYQDWLSKTETVLNR